MPIAVLALAGWLTVTPLPVDFNLNATPSFGPTVGAKQQGEAVERRDRLVYKPRTDLPVTIVATAAWIVAEVDKTHLVSVNCKWCDRAPDGTDSLNALDSWGRHAFFWKHSGRAITFSNITGFVLAPAAAYGLDWIAASEDGHRDNVPADAILITQAMAVASDVTETMKFVIGRERPFVHVLAPLARAETPESADNNTGFPSGHTTLAFALATSSTAIARLRGYRKAPWFLRAGLPLAILTGYFRMAADRHYVLDVLAGAGVGSATGFGLPYLAHRAKTNGRVPMVRVVPVPHGQMVAAQWVW